jgi:hypothetical protein
MRRKENIKDTKRMRRGGGEYYEKWEGQNNYRKLYNLMPT